MFMRVEVKPRSEVHAATPLDSALRRSIKERKRLNWLA
jgi:hypothetical protein